MDTQNPVGKMLKVCSYNVCANGHQWQPAVAIQECPGCHSPVLAVRMEQCPVCNEPTEEFALRTDHFNERGMRIEALCKARPTHAEVSQVVLKRNHAKETEAGREVTVALKADAPNAPSAPSGEPLSPGVKESPLGLGENID